MDGAAHHKIHNLLILFIILGCSKINSPPPKMSHNYNWLTHIFSSLNPDFEPFTKGVR
jgi:hypothetical protein